jgi:ribosome-associated protein
MGVSEAAPAEGVEQRDPPGAHGGASTGGSKGGTIIGTETIVRSSSQDLLHLIETSLADDKAIDVAIIDLAGKTAFADAMVIATGSSQRHIAAMAQHVLERLKAAGLPGLGAEGRGQSDWVLIDAGDVIVHLFKGETRRFYDLERLWGTPLPDMRVQAGG